jgi:hypothetical protein
MLYRRSYVASAEAESHGKKGSSTQEGCMVMVGVFECM